MNDVIIIAITLTVLVFQNLSVLKRFPNHQKIPMQFGANGQPTWSAKRNIFAAIIPLIALGTLLPILILFHFVPEFTEKVRVLTLLFVCIVLVLCNLLHHTLLKRYFSR